MVGDFYSGRTLAWILVLLSLVPIKAADLSCGSKSWSSIELLLRTYIPYIQYHTSTTNSTHSATSPFWYTFPFHHSADRLANNTSTNKRQWPNRHPLRRQWKPMSRSCHDQRTDNHNIPIKRCVRFPLKLTSLFPDLLERPPPHRQLQLVHPLRYLALQKPITRTTRKPLWV